MIERIGETIVAVASGAGHAPLGIVRLSGPRALAIASKLFGLHEDALTDPAKAFRLDGAVSPTPTIRLPAFLYAFRAPHSYTREIVTEIHAVGSPAALECVRRAAMAMGALAAQPGEFTARAFFNGAMDLSAAEGVAAVITARSDTQLRASRRLMDGTLHKLVEQARDEIAELLALVEADIDFAEEPIEFITPAALREKLEALDARMDSMNACAATHEQLDALPRILLLGPPNAGKSSLVNALTGVPRALATPVAGTTRDLLSAPLKLGLGEAVLLDAAGIDESSDPILAHARSLALAAAERVDLVCLVIDVAATPGDPLAGLRGLRLPAIVLAANKSDLLAGDELSSALTRLRVATAAPVFPVSALHRTGLDALRNGFAAALGDRAGTAGAEGIVLTERQRAAIREARAALARAGAVSRTAAETIDSADVLAFELREALDALAVVTGEVTTDDLLARVFATFCIGK